MAHIGKKLRLRQAGQVRTMQRLFKLPRLFRDLGLQIVRLTPPNGNIPEPDNPRGTALEFQRAAG